jgi:hypothetical protein
MRGCRSQDGAVRGVASRCAVGVGVDELSTSRDGDGGGNRGGRGLEEGKYIIAGENGLGRWLLAPACRYPTFKLVPFLSRVPGAPCAHGSV